MVVSNILYFHLYLGKWSNLTNIFQMGWFNHQLAWHFRNLTSNFWSFNPSCLPRDAFQKALVRQCAWILWEFPGWTTKLTAPALFLWSIGRILWFFVEMQGTCVCVPVTCQLPVLLSLLISRFKICFWRGYWIQLSGPEAGELEGF